MKLLISLLISLFSSVALAANGTFQITCNQNVTALSQQFIDHQWVRTSMPWFASWSHDQIGDYVFVGGMRTIFDRYPRDANPHLTFLNPEVDFNDEMGEIIMCRYKINNLELMDIGNVLEMRTFVYLPENSCYVSSNDTVTCKE